MSQSGRYHGGLVFLGAPDNTLDRFSRIVTATLEDYGHPVERQSILNWHEARILSSHYMVKLTVADAPASDMFRAPGSNGPSAKKMQRLEISLSPVAHGQDDTDISQLILVVMLYRMVDVFATQYIEWLEPDMLLTLDQFLGAFTNVSPRRVRGRQEILVSGDAPFTSVDVAESGLSQQYDAIAGQPPHDQEVALIDMTEEETLALSYRFTPQADVIDAMSPEDEAQNDIRRLATWGMTGMMVFLSAPVAASMAVVNLARGEDFRLNTNVLSLTGLLVVLQSSGALASVVSHLPM